MLKPGMTRRTQSLFPIRSLTGWLGLLLCLAWMGWHPVQAESLQSRSGQFVISWVDDLRSTPSLNVLEKNRGMVALTPELIALTAEQVKTGILQALGVQDSWRNKIRITFGTVHRNKEPFITMPTRYASGWGFRILLQPKINEEVWLRNLVHVILLEIVNRPSPEQMCQPPDWLIEGMREYVVHASLVDHSLTVEDMVSVGKVDNRLGKTVPSFIRRESTFAAQQFLRNQNPLTAEQIFAGEREWVRTPHFRHCAHLMFRELTLVENGQRSMQRFIELLPQYLNWQTAFHRAYVDSFPNMLNLEKWWAVLTASVTQFNEKRRWNMERSLEELGRLLNPQAKVAATSEDLPQWQTFAFKDILANWSKEQREAQIRRLTQQLQVLKQNTVFEMVPLLDAYLELLQSFENQMSEAGYEPEKRGQLILRESQIIKRTIRKLDNLERRRATFLENYKALGNPSAKAKLTSR